MNRIIFMVGILALSLGIVIGSLFFLLNKQDTPKERLLPDTIQLVAPSIVSISGTIMDETGVTSRDGTGIIVQSDGLILTSKHLISEGFTYTVTLDSGEEFAATLIKNHPTRDLALLSIVSSSHLSLPVGKFINSQTGIQQGENVIAIGNTLGLYSGSVSSGIISGLNRTVSFGGILMDGLIQTTLPMHLGNSGGPLIDLHGNIMGINTGIVSGSSQIGWALPITQSEVDDFIKN